MNQDELTINSEADRLSILKSVADAASFQARITNRLWLAVFTNIVFVIRKPKPDGSGSHLQMQLPFNFGEVEAETYYLLAMLMLCSLVFSLAISHAQQMRTDRIAQYVVGNITQFGVADNLSFKLHLRDLFDILRQSTLTRVAPLPQLISGEYATPGLEDSDALKQVTTRTLKFKILYRLFKVLVFTVLFVFPVGGICMGFWRCWEVTSGILVVVIGFLGFVAASSIGMAASFEVKYIRKLLMDSRKGSV